MRQSDRFRLLILWILVNSISWSIAYSIAIFFSGGWLFTVSWVGLYAGKYGAFQGAIVGIAQWLVLRRTRPITLLWIVLTIVGWFAAFSLYPLLPNGAFLNGIIPLCLTGLVQARLLRMSLGQAGLWCLSIAAGWSVGWFVGEDIGLKTADPYTYTYQYIGPVTGAIAGAIYGLSTGGVLVRLKTNPEDLKQGIQA